METNIKISALYYRAIKPFNFPKSDGEFLKINTDDIIGYIDENSKSLNCEKTNFIIYNNEINPINFNIKIFEILDFVEDISEKRNIVLSEIFNK